MESGSVKWLILGALGIAALASMQKREVGNTGLTTPQVSQLMENPLSSGNYSNEQEIAAAILNSSNTTEALAAVKNIVSPPPLSSEQLSSPTQNYNYGKTFGMFDTAALGLDQPVNQPSPVKVTVSQAEYNNMVEFLQNMQQKYSRASGARYDYYKAVYDREKAQFDQWVVG